jgi:ABC-type Fe3+/spermidine/putrescine transport system ATPase subunit
VAIRPEKVRVHQSADDGVDGRVVASRYRGASTVYEIELASGRSIAASLTNTDRGRGFHPGERVAVSFPPDHLVLLEEIGDGDAEAPVQPEPAKAEVS